MAKPKIAIVHDWLVGGGAERVVLELHRIYPDAPIYTSYATKDWQRKLDGKVVTGYLQRWPFSGLRKFLVPLRALWFWRLDLREFDIIISSKGNGEASYVRKKPHQKHVCYCHSPTHFYWRKYDDYMQNPGMGWLNPIARLGLRVLVGPMRRWDRSAMQKPDVIIANSTHIQNEIKKSYGRESSVIYPPVDTARFTAIKKRSGKHFVAFGRQVPYKRFDIIVRACSELNEPLVVLGSGPEHERLKDIAGPSVRFVNPASDQDIDDTLADAKAFLFAAEEDFGISPVEALAAGVPVIAYKAGGALDYIQPGVNGYFFEPRRVDSLKTALARASHTKLKSARVRESSDLFSTAEFVRKMKGIVSV